MTQSVRELINIKTGWWCVGRSCLVGLLSNEFEIIHLKRSFKRKESKEMPRVG